MAFDVKMEYLFWTGSGIASWNFLTLSKLQVEGENGVWTKSRFFAIGCYMLLAHMLQFDYLVNWFFGPDF